MIKEFFHDIEDLFTKFAEMVYRIGRKQRFAKTAKVYAEIDKNYANAHTRKVLKLLYKYDNKFYRKHLDFRNSVRSLCRETPKDDVASHERLKQVMGKDYR